MSFIKDEILEIFAVIGALLGSMFACYVFIMILIDFHGRYTCGQFENITGKSTEWVFLDECYIKHNNEMTRYSVYKDMQLARDGLSGGDK